MKLEEILEGFRKPEISTDHVWDGWYHLKLKMGGPMSSRIRPLFTPIKIAGTAVTVKLGGPGRIGKAWLKAQEIAGPNNVIVIDDEGDENHGAWGGKVSIAAKINGIEGVVVDGATRDWPEIKEAQFPVFAKAVCMGYRPEPWEGVDQLNVSIICGGVLVRPGDVIVGADDGVMVVPVEHAEEVLEWAKKVVKFDAKEERYIRAGWSVRRIFEEEMQWDSTKKFEWAEKPDRI